MDSAGQRSGEVPSDHPSADPVIIRIDENTCVGAGACMVHAPTEIEPGEDGTARVDPDATFARARAEDMRADCPSGAISIHEVDR